MKHFYLVAFLISFAVFAVACDGGPKRRASGKLTELNLLEIANGKIFYEANCGGCHSAGLIDPISAFGASDLTKSNHISTDMSNQIIYGGPFNLMKRFSNISKDRIRELKAYLVSIT